MIVRSSAVSRGAFLFLLLGTLIWAGCDSSSDCADEPGTADVLTGDPDSGPCETPADAATSCPDVEACPECPTCPDVEECPECTPEGEETVQVPVSDFTDLMAQLQGGRLVRVDIDLSQCTDVQGTPLVDQAYAGIEIDVWEYFAKMAVYNAHAYVTFSTQSLRGNADQPYYRYFKLRVYETGEVQVSDQRVDAVTFEEISMVKSYCRIENTEEPEGGAAFRFEARRDLATGEVVEAERILDLPTLIDALRSGRRVRTVYDYGECLINGTGEGGPEAIGGLTVHRWEHFPVGTHPDEDNEEAFVVVDENSLISIPGFGLNGFIFDWVFARVFEDGAVRLNAQYLHPTNFSVQMSEYFDCTLEQSADDAGGVSLFID